MAEETVVRLSAIKFAKLKPQDPRATSNKNVNQAAVAQSHVASGEPPFATPRLKPYERLAADKTGEELAPEGVIWQMYVDEAKEYDSELVEGENRNLDLMLVFASLFSAILTAFIIESKSLLQEDASETTIVLLLAIAQSQQRVEQGNPKVFPPIERQSFSPTLSARCINGLWFTSLALSLSAALIAMLAKEWLAAFTATRPRPSHAHSMVHQARLQGLIKWRAQNIIDLLPTMLHLSLLLFSLGLAVYLWTLDSGIAIAEVVITAATLFFYGTTAILAAIYSSCPFITQVSKHLSIILKSSLKATKTLAGRSHIPPMTSSHVTSESELQALLWLTENARDPAIGDCACQALNGFRNIKATATSLEPESTRDSEAGTPDLNADRKFDTEAENDATAGSVTETLTEASIVDIANQDLTAEVPNDMAYLTPYRFTLIKSLFDAVHMRFSQARLRLPQESTENGGMHMAQYASLLPALVLALERDAKIALNDTGGGKRNSKQMIFSAAAPSLRALDTVWNNQCPELSPDAYATLTAAELQLTESVTLAHHVTQPPLFTHTTSPLYPYASIAVNPSFDGVFHKKISLQKLRARYSRALSRAGYLLRYHNTYGQRISVQPLMYLLKSIHQAALRKELNPEAHLSTCFPQSKSSEALPEFRVQIASSGMSHWVKPLYIGDEDGVISGLVQVLAYAGIHGDSAVELVAGNCLATVGPMLLKQWLHMMEEQQQNRFGELAESIDSVEKLLNYWPGHRETEELEGVVRWALSQLLVVFSISLALSNYPQMSDLQAIVTDQLCSRAKTTSGCIAMSEILTGYDTLVCQTIILVERNGKRIETSALINLLSLFLTQHPDPKYSRHLIVLPSVLPQFLRFLASVPDSLENVELVLKDLQDNVQRECGLWRRMLGPYVVSFFKEEGAFSALASIAYHEAYVSTTVKCITRIVHYAADEGSFASLRLGRVGEPAISGLLEAVKVVINSVANETDESSVLEPFMSEIMSLLRPPHNSQHLSTSHRHMLTEIYDTLSNIEKLPEGFRTKLVELEEWTYVGEALRHIRRLFEDEF
ncbi:regulator of telomere elongation helicase 1 [Ceratobasidium sp. AG-Ba]|nr:regulator of telomere elongation helicase 1 [Ceratobasidium sp. AG-Ba]